MALDKRKLLGAFALIPLGVYALGIPIEVLLRGSGTLIRDGWLPYEVLALVVCFIVAVWSLWYPYPSAP